MGKSVKLLHCALQCALPPLPRQKRPVCWGGRGESKTDVVACLSWHKRAMCRGGRERETESKRERETSSKTYVMRRLFRHTTPAYLGRLGRRGGGKTYVIGH